MGWASIRLVPALSTEKTMLKILNHIPAFPATELFRDGM
jgi:hypothetical protein